MRIEELFVDKKHSLKKVMQVIDKTGQNIAFVVEKGNSFLGTITDSDIRHALMSGKSLDIEAQKIMNINSFSLKEGYSKSQIEKMLNNDIIEKFPIHGAMKTPVLNKAGEVIDMVFVSKTGYNGRFNDEITEIKPVKSVLIVGGAGYLGSVLAEKLLNKGYHVKILDNLMYGDAGLKPIYHYSNFEFIHGDMRNLEVVVEAVKDVDAVIHLAAIVGDPASDLNPEQTVEINHLSTRVLADVCKYSQINRFVFASSASVYGDSKKGELLTETSELNPVSLYAEMKLKSEQTLLELTDENFAPTVLRMGTLHGKSSRMRFDLVVNILAIKAMKDKEFTIFGGEQFRAFCHVEDATNAYIRCLEAPIEKVRGEIFNISTENMMITDVGKLVKKAVPDAKMIVDKKEVDKRDYMVSSDKSMKQIGFKQSRSIKNSIIDIKSAIENGYWSDFPNPKYNNYAYLRGE